MNANATIATGVIAVPHNAGRHRLRLRIGYFLAIALIVALSVYGFDYYGLSVTERPHSPKHVLLKPSGTIGLNLGILGALCFFAIFLYPLRKHWTWLRKGSAKHWLDVHVMLGLSAPFIIAFHSSFKFGGLAGMAFWIMTAVALSGVIGRYVYSQIPRSLNAAELSMRECQDLQAELTSSLSAQRMLPRVDVQWLLKLPSAGRVASMSLVGALIYMVRLDLSRPFRVARLRRHCVGFWEKLTTLGGFRHTQHWDLERTIETAREFSALSKRIVFLSRSQQVFHLWHVIHKPFSYSFAILALIHISVVVMMGFV
ncbi:MAG TPA: hypothetical protein VIV15_11180 [Anaerolineales bacterium]